MFDVSNLTESVLALGELSFEKSVWESFFVR